MIKEGTLILYQMISNEFGPLVGLSLTIKTNFSWTVSYRGQIVPLEHCMLLQNTPSSINSGIKT